MPISQFVKFAENAVDPMRLQPESSPLSPPTSTLRVIVAVLMMVKGPLALIAVTGGLLTLVDTLILWRIGALIDSLGAGGDAAKQALLVFCVLVVCKPTIGFIHLLAKNQCFNPAVGTIARRVFHKHLVGHSPESMRDMIPGRVAAKVSQTGSAVRQGMRIAADQVWTGLIGLTLTLVLLANLNWFLLAPFAIWLPIYILLLKTWVPRNQAAADNSAEALSSLNGTLVDVYDRFSLFKLFAWRKVDPVDLQLGNVLAAVRLQTRVSTYMIASIWALNAALLLSVASIAVLFWSNGDVSIGDVAGAIAVLTRLNAVSIEIMYSLSVLADAVGTLRNSVATVSRPYLCLDSHSAVPPPEQVSMIKFEGVSVCRSNGVPILRNINAEFTRGRAAFIKGRSGEGKSTFFAAIARFVSCSEGQILFNDVPIENIAQDELRRLIAFAPQDPEVFNRSVRDNLSLARPGLKDSDLISALDLVLLRDVVLNRQDDLGRKGLDAHLSQGSCMLSRGELQRLALARIVLSDAPIVLLDEPTSALDPETEKAIWINMLAHMGGRISLVITHRNLAMPIDAVSYVLTNGQLLSHQMTQSNAFLSFE